MAKHLKDGRLKEAIALSASKDYRYSHLAKVVLAGLQEYQFQQESGDDLNRDDVLDTVRRSIQRATGADRLRPEEGRQHAGHHRLDGTVRRTARHGRRRHQRVRRHRVDRVGRYRAACRPVLPKRSSRPRSGLFVAIPAVWFYNYLTSRLEYFNVEMDNSSSELVDYFIKKTA